MTHVYYHAQSSARTFGGVPEDYLALHNFMDEHKEHYADFRYRAVRHHSLGIFQGETRFGVVITNSDGKQVPVRLVLEQHCIEDLSFVPTLADWLSCINPQPWMARATRTNVARQHLNRRNTNE